MKGQGVRGLFHISKTSEKACFSLYVRFPKTEAVVGKVWE